MANAAAAHYFEGRAGQNVEIEPYRLMIYVPAIHGQSLIPVHCVASMNLGPARDAGFNEMSTRLLAAVPVHVAHEKWPGTDKAHLAGEHVDELGQLIQTGGPQKLPQSGQTLAIGQGMAVAITRFAHGAELVHRERMAVKAGALLTKENRRPHGDAHSECHGGHQRTAAQ